MTSHFQKWMRPDSSSILSRKTMSPQLRYKKSIELNNQLHIPFIS